MSVKIMAGPESTKSNPVDHLSEYELYCDGVKSACSSGKLANAVTEKHKARKYERTLPNQVLNAVAEIPIEGIESEVTEQVKLAHEIGH